MADKNITLRQKNTSGAYDKLYTKTTATQSKLSTETAELFGNNVTDADAAMSKVADTIKAIGDVQVKVVDPNGNPIQGARITGLYGTPTTASDGTAHGVLQTNPISISSPYIDLKDQTADASGYAGSFNVLTVTLPIVGENSITRITSSKTVKFSKAVKSVDVCCVGAGGGGGSYFTQSSEYHNGGGGGGGAIVNNYTVSLTANTPYSISIGAGGTTGQTAGAGGTTSFASISAAGGGGAYINKATTTNWTGGGGTAGLSGCGDGGSERSKNGSSNTTISEFNDGITFYSGGGGAGGLGSTGYGNGGTPNGARGAYTYNSTGYNALTAGIGGGGGGGAYNRNTQALGNPSAGGPGLVAIRFHF